MKMEKPRRIQLAVKQMEEVIRDSVLPNNTLEGYGKSTQDSRAIVGLAPSLLHGARHVFSFKKWQKKKLNGK